jgi:hypothetical protein
MLLTIFLLERKDVNRSLDFDHFSLLWRGVKQAFDQVIHWWWLPNRCPAPKHVPHQKYANSHFAPNFNN